MTKHILIDPEGRSQTALSKLLGIDQSFLSRIIRGERRPSLEQAEKIADEFRVHVLHVMAPVRYDRNGERRKEAFDGVLHGHDGN